MAYVGSKPWREIKTGDAIFIKHGRGERQARVVSTNGGIVMVQTHVKSTGRWTDPKMITNIDYIREYGKASNV